MDEGNELSFVDLGPSEEVFRPSLLNIIAGFILGLFFVGFGLVMIVWVLHAVKDPKETNEAAKTAGVVIFCGAGGMFAIGGLCFAWFSFWLLSHRVEICQNGILYRAREGDVSIAWSDISLIRETTLYERPPILHAPAIYMLPKVKSKYFTIVMKSGKEYVFDENRVHAVNRFGRHLDFAARARSIRWATAEEHGDFACTAWYRYGNATLASTDPLVSYRRCRVDCTVRQQSQHQSQSDGHVPISVSPQRRRGVHRSRHQRRSRTSLCARHRRRGSRRHRRASQRWLLSNKRAVGLLARRAILGPRHCDRGRAPITPWAIERFGLLRIEAGVFSWNPASARVLEKCGYVLEGRHHKSVIKDGTVLDHLMYAYVV